LAKKRLTPRQQEWETEYKKLKRRVSEWKRKFHAVPDLPTKPERITKKDIERLKEFKWKNIPEAIKKVWRKEYEYRYENKMPEVYQPKQQYTPPTEQDFYSNPDYGDEYDEEWEEQHPGWDEPDEDDYTETALRTLPKDKPVALYCRSGNRSKNAAGILAEKGYEVVELGTGFRGWLAAGKNIVKP
jgi:rhodanese-related sulfurtransferase